jgi:hypothetical protein
MAGMELYPKIYRDKIFETRFDPAFATEPIIVATLTPGNYTIQCRSADGGQGIANVEIYEY